MVVDYGVASAVWAVELMRFLGHLRNGGSAQIEFGDGSFVRAMSRWVIFKRPYGTNGRR
jgi:hypothetical protein